MDDGRRSDERGSLGDSSNLSGTICLVRTGDLVGERRIDGGGESERVSGEFMEGMFALRWEKAATAARLEEAVGLA